MFKKLMLVATVAALFAVPAQAANVGLAVNGDFESGNFYGWDLFPSTEGVQEIVSPGQSGDFAARILNTAETSGSVIKNANLTVLGEGFEPGSLVTTSFWARGVGEAGGVAFAEFFSEIEGGGTSSNEILGGGPLALDPDPTVWTYFEFNALTGPDTSGGVTVQFAAVTGADPASTMELFVDNLVVIIDCAVDNEATTWGGVKGLYR